MKKVEIWEATDESLKIMYPNGFPSHFCADDCNDVTKFISENYIDVGTHEYGATAHFIYNNGKTLFGIQYHWDPNAITIESIPPSDTPKGLIDILKKNKFEKDEEKITGEGK
jgi:hypothetical protein